MERSTDSPGKIQAKTSIVLCCCLKQFTETCWMGTCAGADFSLFIYGLFRWRPGRWVREKHTDAGTSRIKQPLHIRMSLTAGGSSTITLTGMTQKHGSMWWLTAKWKWFVDLRPWQFKDFDKASACKILAKIVNIFFLIYFLFNVI